MKRVIIVFIAVAFITLLIPLAAVYLIGAGNEAPSKPVSEGTVSVYIADEDKVVEMEIGEYLKGVVAAEMPAEFEDEALKAQAVAARTYLYSRMKEKENPDLQAAHNGAEVCTDYRHCQAYTDKEPPENISKAVEDTADEIMTYNGEIISALFHSTSSGNTEAAADVWGSDIPYLRSVKSEGDLQSPKYLSSLTVSVEEFKATAEEKLDGVDWSNGLFSDIERSEAGGIISLAIGGVSVRGTDFRSMFNLRSTNVEIEEKDGSVVMNVRGYGHGVGMSQYGANYMAENGSDYTEILKTYYTGIEIEKR